MKNSKTHVTKLVFLAMMVALGVVISPILRVEGMCPMAHFINVPVRLCLVPGMLSCALWLLASSVWYVWVSRLWL